jgi:Na+/H+ antiporter NhaA
MAIFVTGLAFTDAQHAERVKSAVLVASVLASVLGALCVRVTERRR